MPHGIDGYFETLSRDRTRMARFGVAVSVAVLLVELVLRHPAAVSTLNDPKRFGFEGPDQYVRRILLEMVAENEQPGANLQNLVPVEMRAGGGTTRAKTSDEGTKPAAARRGIGPGDDEANLLARMRALALEGPVVRSEDLVAERLVRPEYPEAARDADIEGLVELVALVDTTGAVREVHILGGTHEPLLENAATSAALQCRYRPYRLTQGTPQPVWAYFRVNFSLY